MAKPYTVEKEINGKKYVCQFNGISAALDAVDSTYIDGTNTTSVTKMANYLFKNVVVQPSGLTPDDFDNMDEFNEVITFAREVMQGEFRDKTNESSTEKKSKE